MNRTISRSMGLSIGIWLTIAVALFTAQSALAKTALVIGNSAYSSAPLDNPVNDATDIASKLRQLEFEVNILTDASRREMRRAIREYSNKLETSGGVGLFYYAGHGMQIKGVNYLIPVDAVMRDEFEIPDEAVAANSVLRALEDAGNELNIVVLDACRDNPFARSYRSASTRGLARMDAPGGSIIAYATAPGDVALDGDGRNGVYTKHLLENMGKPGMPIEQMFKKVRIGVIDESGGQQTPWEESSLRSDFYFSPAKVYEVAIPQQVPKNQVLTSQPLKTQPAAVSTQPAGNATDNVGPDPLVEELLDNARMAMDDYRLTTPERNNALYFYREALKLEPQNFDAHDGLQRITQRYIALAEREIRVSNPNKASTFVARGLEVQPQNAKLQDMELDIVRLRLEQTNEELSRQSEEVVFIEQPAPAPASTPELNQTGNVVITEPAAVENTDVQTASNASQTEQEVGSVSQIQQAKQEFNRDVKAFKKSLFGIGKSIKSKLDGVLKKGDSNK